MKLTVIGAGSLGFTRILLTDILSVKELQKNIPDIFYGYQ